MRHRQFRAQGTHFGGETAVLLLQPVQPVDDLLELAFILSGEKERNEQQNEIPIFRKHR
jgi:hypothetical protein